MQYALSNLLLFLQGSESAVFKMIFCPKTQQPSYHTLTAPSFSVLQAIKTKEANFCRWLTGGQCKVNHIHSAGGHTHLKKNQASESNPF